MTNQNKQMGNYGKLENTKCKNKGSNLKFIKRKKCKVEKQNEQI